MYGALSAAPALALIPEVKAASALVKNLPTVLRYGAGIVRGGGTGAVVTPLMMPTTGEGDFLGQKRQQAELGGVFGAAFPAVAAPLTGLAKQGGRIVSAAGRKIADLSSGLFGSPTRQAANALYEAAGTQAPDVLNALIATQNMPVTPGYTPTMTERLVEANVRNPVIARLEREVTAASPEVNLMTGGAQDVNAAAIQNQLLRAQQNLPTSRFNLPPTGQAAPGAELTKIARGIKKEIKSTRIDPAYKTAFAEAGGTRIDVTPIIAKAEEILGRPLSKLNPNAVTTNTEQRLLNIFDRGAPEVPPTRDSFGMLRDQGTPSRPPTGTLEEVDALRKAINSDIASAKNRVGPLDPTKARSLYDLHGLIDEVVTNSTLSPEAKKAYATAVSSYRETVVPRFKTGTTAKMLQSTSYNQSKVLPEKVVSQYFTESGSKQFGTTFAGDFAANQAMRKGVESLFRAETYNPVTKAIDADKAARFLSKNRQTLQNLDDAGVNVSRNLTEETALANTRNEIAALEKQNATPEKLDLSVSQLAQNYSSQQLTDLNIVANDLNRQSAVRGLRDRKSPSSPKATELATEDFPSMPTPFDVKLTVARSIAKILGESGNPKAAAKLAEWMYKNPEGAIKSLSARVQRADLKAKIAGKTRGVRQVIATLPRATVNMLAGQSEENQNAMSQPR
jgi:hypothetical protein